MLPYNQYSSDSSSLACPHALAITVLLCKLALFSSQLCVHQLPRGLQAGALKEREYLLMLWEKKNSDTELYWQQRTYTQDRRLRKFTN